MGGDSVLGNSQHAYQAEHGVTISRRNYSYFNHYATAKRYKKVSGFTKARAMLLV
jgi:hypothetical protein